MEKVHIVLTAIAWPDEKKKNKQNLSYEKSDRTDKSVGMIAGERKIERNEQQPIEKKEQD